MLSGVNVIYCARARDGDGRFLFRRRKFRQPSRRQHTANPYAKSDREGSFLPSPPSLEQRKERALIMNKIEGGNLSRRGRGRPKGSENKVAKAAKEVIAEAADRLGGVDRVVDWAKEDPKNESAFWATIYPKLLPLQVNASVTQLSPEAAAWLGSTS